MFLKNISRCEICINWTKYFRRCFLFTASFVCFIRIVYSDIYSILLGSVTPKYVSAKYDVLVLTAGYHLYETIFYWDRLNGILIFHHLFIATLYPMIVFCYFSNDLACYITWLILFGTHWINPLCQYTKHFKRSLMLFGNIVEYISLGILIYYYHDFLDVRVWVYVSFLIAHFCDKFTNQLGPVLLLVVMLIELTSGALNKPLFMIYETLLPNVQIQYIKTLQWLADRSEFVCKTKPMLDVLKCEFPDMKSITEIELSDIRSTLTVNGYILKSIDDRPFGCGSTGRVFRGKISCVNEHDGGDIDVDFDVAIKVLRQRLKTDHQFIHNMDVSILDLVLSCVTRYFAIPSIPIKEIYRLYNQSLDFENEARYAEMFFDVSRDLAHVSVPYVYASTKHVIIYSYLRSVVPVMGNEELAYQYLVTLRQFIVQGVLKYGIYHLDLHNKNWGIDLSNNEWNLVVYDFGHCCQIDRDLLLQFLRAVISQNIINAMLVIFEHNHNTNIDLTRISEMVDKVDDSDILTPDDILRIFVNVANKLDIRVDHRLFEIFKNELTLSNDINEYFWKYHHSHTNFLEARECFLDTYVKDVFDTMDTDVTLVRYYVNQKYFREKYGSKSILYLVANYYLVRGLTMMEVINKVAIFKKSCK